MLPFILIERFERLHDGRGRGLRSGSEALRIVGKNVDRAEYVNGTRNHFKHRCTIAHVNGEAMRRSSIGPDLTNDLLNGFLRPGRNDDLGAFCGKHLRDSTADTPAGARHDCNLSAESLHLEPLILERTDRRIYYSPNRIKMQYGQ